MHDHIFCCFVLEHLPDPHTDLQSLKRVLRPGGTLTVIEGDYGSFFSFPETAESRKTVQCLVKLQEEAGGNALIGREIYPLLRKAGFCQPLVSPRMVYVDSSRPELVEGFSRNTFIAMVEGVKPQAMEMQLMEEKEWDRGISDLYAATKEDGVFCYTFFKGRALR